MIFKILRATLLLSSLCCLYNRPAIAQDAPKYLYHLETWINNISDKDLWIPSQDGSYIFPLEASVEAALHPGQGGDSQISMRLGGYAKGPASGGVSYRTMEAYTGELASSAGSGCGARATFPGINLPPPSDLAPRGTFLVNSVNERSGTETVPFSIPQYPGVPYYSILTPDPADGGIFGVQTSIRCWLSEYFPENSCHASASANVLASFQMNISIQVDRKRRPGREPGPELPFWGCADDKVHGGINLATGNALITVDDPIPTRGYPLRNRIHVNSQTVEFSRPMANATFSYDIHVTTQALPIPGGSIVSQWVLVDGDGQRLVYGPASNAPTPEPGVFGVLTQTANGFELMNAGPPESIREFGHYKYTFDAAGKLQTLTDPAGNVQALTYDTQTGHLTRVTDLSSNKLIDYIYTGDRITTVSENGGAALSNLTYTADRLTNISRTDGTNSAFSVAFTYDGYGAFASVTKDGDSATTRSFSYHAAPSYEPGFSNVYLARYTDPSGPSQTILWDADPVQQNWFRTGVRNTAGGITWYDFDESLNLRNVTYPAPEGSASPVNHTFVYDSQRNLTQASYGGDTYNATYNAVGQPTLITKPSTGYREYTYSNGNVTEINDNYGLVANIYYDNSLLPNNATRVVNVNGDTWTFTYNTQGQLTQVQPPTGSPLGATTLAYNELLNTPEYGWLKSITDGEGNIVSFDSYDTLGNAISISTDPDPSTPLTRLSESFDYDAASRLRTELHPDGKSLEWNYTGLNLTSTEDEAAATTNYTWCPGCGGLDSISKALGWSLSFNRDYGHALSEFKDARTRSTQYIRGVGKELKSIQYPDGSSESFTYNSDGKVSTHTNGRGQVTTYGYTNGQFSSETYSDTSEPARSFTWRLDGLPSTVTDASGTTTYNYNNAKQLTSVAYNYSAAGLTNAQTVEYEYYADESLKKITWKDGSTTVATWQYSYDAAGNLTGVVSPGATATLSYDGQGKLLSQINSNGTRTDYVYNDARGWPTSITHKRGGTAFQQFSLTYDDGNDTVGNLSGVTELDGSTVTYGYDALYRLTSEVRSGQAPYSRTNEYDLAGNLTKINGNDFALYDDANNISSLNGVDITNYSDADGNLTGIPIETGLSTSSFTWNTESKLTSQSAPLVTTTYGYNAQGLRVRSQYGSGAKRFYIFAGDDLIGEIADGAPAVAYTWAKGKLLSQYNLCTGNTLWYAFGPQGETRALTDSLGVVVDSYTYTGYGVPVASTGSDYNPFRYGGRFGYYSDGVNGLILAGQRWYRPHLARWLGRDPIRYEGGANLYGYVEGNPIRYSDATGLLPGRGGTASFSCNPWHTLQYFSMGHFRERRMGGRPTAIAFNIPATQIC